MNKEFDYENWPPESLITAAIIGKGDLGSLQKAICKDSGWSLHFCKTIPGADIAYCQKHACKDYKDAYLFTAFIPESDVEFCYGFSKEFKEDIEEYIVSEL